MIMSSGTSMRTATFTTIGALVLGVFLGGCGGISPGQYVVFEIAESAPQKQSDCYGSMGEPADVEDSSTSINTNATWYIFAGSNNQLYLDTGMASLEGATSSNGYTFAGKTVAVMFTDGQTGTGDKNETVTAETVAITTSGNAVSGSDTSVNSTSCTPGMTGGCPNFMPTNCTTVTSFVGTQVNNVQLQHTL
jgi:hypothetical protein